ncbi:hypothetical protein [Legionella quateirensis]|uniref:Uncharacterized protein n=1 Tax=Legionella quateirensis TaxID=45072 RepID=A0A378KUS2_9GAMM|nr:hypothetical protein [Legionella quateirensis]KTD53026.1 hypothetical protein Lqua_0859 [Legionella quateirensis]STY17247.1 Uncharacterised protein [Legionella quateirensis]
MFDKTAKSPEQKEPPNQLLIKATKDAEKPAMSRYASCWPSDYNNSAFKRKLSPPSSLPVIPEVEEDTIPEDNTATSTGYNPYSFIRSWSNRNGTVLEPIIEEDEEFTEKKPVQDENLLNFGQDALDDDFERITTSIK